MVRCDVVISRLESPITLEYTTRMKRETMLLMLPRLMIHVR
jgi:hypothetical protein